AGADQYARARAPAERHVRVRKRARAWNHGESGSSISTRAVKMSPQKECKIRAYMERRCGQRWSGTALGVAILFISWGRGAYGLDPTLDVSQYAHTAWTVRDGFSKGNIYAITQTPDGYLWLGTEFGLFRFDGIRSIPWQPPEGQHLPGSSITSLLAARDGTLWIGTYAGLASWIGGKLTVHPELNAQFVTSLFEDRDGTVWAGTLANSGRLCALRSGGAQCYG